MRASRLPSSPVMPRPSWKLTSYVASSWAKMDSSSSPESVLAAKRSCSSARVGGQRAVGRGKELGELGDAILLLYDCLCAAISRDTMRLT